ncbi:hypothetical protein GWK47_051258 [Chionoecetes opilio]|uniref:Uncharacterized protein n=1 Tax=Chionoecetes opilio TaxID=41210 RepID=A0A8J5CSG6_CHIOP|nr:hypothetical protein GWK47_051258 [Chionoecetes opilio]
MPDTVRKIHIAHRRTERPTANITTTQSQRASTSTNKNCPDARSSEGTAGQVEGSPTPGVCGSPNSADHNMDVQKGGISRVSGTTRWEGPDSQHAREVCPEVSTEPTLPCPRCGNSCGTGQHTRPEARVDISCAPRARGFWTEGSGPFSRQRVFDRWPPP